MSRYVSEELASLVVHRAKNYCEYRHINIVDTYFGGEIDHIRSIKHGGETEPGNLALACLPCNRFKGSDLGSISDGSGELVRFFNPRIDNWNEMFRLDIEGTIQPLNPIGEVTAAIFKFNDRERIEERLGLIEIGQFKDQKNS